MKKLFASLLCVMMLVACSTTDTADESTTTEQPTTNSTESSLTDEQVLNTKIKITVNNQEVIIALDNAYLGKQLIEALPQTYSFTDYGNCEKAADVQNLIDVGDTTLGYEPQPGDVVVYEPWGNFTVFYDEFRYSDALAVIGHVESGLDVLSSIDGGFEATVEVVE